MRNITFYLCFLIFSLTANPLLAQEKTYFEKVEELERQKEEIIKEEKQALKLEVKNIHQRLEAGKLTREEAEVLKEAAAKKHALNIENRIAIIDNKIALLSRQERDKDFNSDGEDGEDGDSEWVFDWGSDDRDKKYDRRTYTDLVVAVGFNNALQEGQSLNDSDFKVAGSRFFELGIAWKTRVFQETNWLRIKYGVSFQFNGLKPTDNRYYVTDGDETVLIEHDFELDKSKFRMDNLVVPIHFEFGPSKKVESERSLRYYTDGKLKVGLGGYAGFNLGDRQKLKYEDDGENVKKKLKGDYNTNEFIYGLSGYLGWGGSALYVKYDLNTIFKEPNAELHNFSVGLRFDMD